MQQADFIIAGAGHNSLITACYLAKAGFSVVALDSRPVPGGGAATEELMLPGYLIDSCSTGHTVIQANPLMVNDELGLLSDHGLQYVDPDPVAHVRFPDGEHFTQHLDLDGTLDEIGRFSKADAKAFARMMQEWGEVRRVFGAEQFSPIGDGKAVDRELEEMSTGHIWQRRRLLSAWDIIRHEFEDKHIRSFMLWQAYQSLVRPDSPGSGLMAYSLVCSRQLRSWTIPLGGSGRLTDALVDVLKAHGGQVVVNQHVDELILDDGRCVGVHTRQGESFHASKAVVSSIHVKHLIDMAPTEAWDESWRYGIETYEVGTSAFAVYMATTRAPTFDVGGRPSTAVAAGFIGWPEDLLSATRDYSEGIWRHDPQWVMMAAPTLVDQSRVPHEGQHTVKIISPSGWRLPEGESWDGLKEKYAKTLLELLRTWDPEFTDDVILDTLVKGPFDFEASNPHMIRGAFHGGERNVAWSGLQRPAPGWANHRTPIDGLYQTGATTHPGGSITGAPGRNAAGEILKDFGMAGPMHG